MKAISIPFRLVNPTGRIAMTKTYEEVVRGQMIDALMTNLGERVFRPRYGCDIQSVLFDPSDELVRRDAASRISARLGQLVTRAVIRSVVVDIGAEPGSVIIKVIYRSTLYSTDTEIAVPVASEFINRQGFGGLSSV